MPARIKITKCAITIKVQFARPMISKFQGMRALQGQNSFQNASLSASPMNSIQVTWQSEAPIEAHPCKLLNKDKDDHFLHLSENFCI